MPEPKTWVEISRSALIHNFEQFRARLPAGVEIMPVIKSNAYGHGLATTVQILAGRADCWGVDSIDEALAVHKISPNSRVVILGYTLRENLPLVFSNGFEQVIGGLPMLIEAEQITGSTGLLAKVHLKIETGTSRQGVKISELDQCRRILTAGDRMKLVGVSTHYANIEDTTDHTFAMAQLAEFNAAIKYLRANGLADFSPHTACSAAAVLFEQTHFSLVRLGISLYGLWSSTETQVMAKLKNIDINLQPALSWKTRAAQVKTLPAGAHISYGCTEKVERPTKVAILPVGYWDGYPRALSSVGNVLIRGKRCKVLGRVCMNMMIVDADHLPELEFEETAVLLGAQHGQAITAEELARKANTINYEIITRINPALPRIAVD